MWGISICSQCGRPRWGTCPHCNPSTSSVTPPSTGPAPVDPDDWRTMYSATRNAQRLLEEDMDIQEAWRSSLAVSTSNKR